MFPSLETKNRSIKALFAARERIPVKKPVCINESPYKTGGRGFILFSLGWNALLCRLKGIVLIAFIFFVFLNGCTE
jgi:hypothetical protein